MKNSHCILILSVVIAGLIAGEAGAAFPQNVRQTLQMAGEDVAAALPGASLPAKKGISVLPLAGDEDGYVEGLLKNAVSAAGLIYVEGKDDPFWDEIISEIAWNERKEDILDAATLVKFGRLKATQLLLYGHVREASESGQKVFVEIELHLSSIETKQHIWGKVFTKRYYLPGEVQGIITLDQDVRRILREAFEAGAAALQQSQKLSAIGTVAIVPLAGDIDGYVTGLAEDMISQSRLNPKNLDVGTLAEARNILRDRPQQADAVMYGAVRDLSKKLDKVEFLKKTYKVFTEVQVRVQAAQTGEVLWAKTLAKEEDVVEEQTLWEWATSFFKQNPRVLLWAVGIVVALIVISWFLKAVSRPR